MKKIYNTKKITKVCLLMLSLSAGMTSCSDLLDKEPPSAISNGSFWTGESDAMLALTGCYCFHSGWTNDDFATPLGLMYLDFAGGNGTEKESFTSLMASSNTVATNSNLERYWSNAYNQIANYNTFLDNIGNCPMDENKKKVWISEVKCLRAYLFFNLAFYFKNVPMPLTTLSIQQANSIKQTPQDDVYNQVETDLKEAIKILPEKREDNEIGRYTKGAAEVILSRLYLAQKKYADAATVLKTIIDSNVYEIDRRNGDNSYEKLFQIGGESSSEIIFCIMALKDKYTYARYNYVFPEVNGGWHQFAPYNELVKDYFCTDGKSIEESAVYDDNDPYANRDIRLYASIFLPPLGSYPGTVFKGSTYDCFKGAGTNDFYSKYALFNGYCPKKGCDATVSDIYSTYTYTPLMRYAEVLLSYLEALNESQYGAVTQDVLNKTINDIRTRVNLPALTTADLPNQDAVRQAVRKERRVELAFEGLRYFDILRWEIADKVLNHTFTGVKLSNNPADRNYRGTGDSASPVDKDMYYEFEKRTWSSHNRYFPIPQKDMNVNKNLVQNDGYN